MYFKCSQRNRIKLVLERPLLECLLSCHYLQHWPDGVRIVSCAYRRRITHRHTIAGAPVAALNMHDADERAKLTLLAGAARPAHHGRRHEYSIDTNRWRNRAHHRGRRTNDAPRGPYCTHAFDCTCSVLQSSSIRALAAVDRYVLPAGRSAANHRVNGRHRIYGHDTIAILWV